MLRVAEVRAQGDAREQLLAGDCPVAREFYQTRQHLARHGQVQGAAGSAGAKRYPIDASGPVEVQAVDVTFFHYFTVHCSKPKRSAHERRSVLVQLYSRRDTLELLRAHQGLELMLRGWNHRLTRESAFRFLLSACRFAPGANAG